MTCRAARVLAMRLQLRAPRLRGVVDQHRVHTARRIWRLGAQKGLQQVDAAAGGRRAVGLRVARDHPGLTEDAGASRICSELDLHEARGRSRDTVDGRQLRVYERLIAVEDR